jgi:hypothetical protein
MPIEIGVELDLEGTDSQLSTFKSTAKSEFSRAGFEAAEAFMERASKQLDKLDSIVGPKTKKAFSELPGLAGDVGDAIGLLGEDFLGLSKSQMEATENTLALTSKFGQMGAALGPWGALAGAAAGATLGLAKEIKKANDEAEKFMTSLLGVNFQLKVTKTLLAQQEWEKHKQMEAAAKALEAFKGAIGGVASVATDYGAGIATIGEGTKKAGGAARAAAVDFEALNKALMAPALANMGTGLGAAGAANQGRQAAIDEQAAALAKYGDGVNKSIQELNEGFAAASLAAAQFTEPTLNGFQMLTIAAQDLGAEMESALSSIGAGAARDMFDALEAGDPIIRSLGQSFKALSSDALKGIGSELIGRGILDGAHATAMLIKSAGLDPRGWTLATHAGAEVAAGLALGGTGAALGRFGGGGLGGGRGRGDDRGGQSFDGSFSLGRNAASSSTTNNSTTIINVQALDVGDRELWERLGARTIKGIRAFKNAGGPVRDLFGRS